MKEIAPLGNTIFEESAEGRLQHINAIFRLV